MKRELHKVIHRIAVAIWQADEIHVSVMKVKKFSQLSADMKRMYYDFATAAYEEMIAIDGGRVAA